MMPNMNVQIEYIGCDCHKYQPQGYVWLKPMWFHSGKYDDDSHINWHCRTCGEIVEIWSFNRIALLEERRQQHHET